MEPVSPSALPGEIDWDLFWSDPPPPLSYLVEPLLPVGRVVTVHADAKVGKTLIGWDIGLQSATGGTMWGQDLVPIEVLYVDEEMSHADVARLLEAYGFGPDSDLSRFHYCLRSGWPPFDTAAGGQMLLEKGKHSRARLVVIDTQSKVLEGLENDASTMTNFFKYTLGPLKDLGVTVLIFDHSGKDKRRGARGSSAKPADADMTWSLEKRGMTGKLRLTLTHSRLHLEQSTLDLQRQSTPLRHELITVDGTYEEAIDTLVTWLQNNDIDISRSKRDIYKIMRDKGLKFRNDRMSEAIDLVKDDV